MIARPPTSIPFPYTTLFRSHAGAAEGSGDAPRPAPELENGAAGLPRQVSSSGAGRSEEHTSELQSLAYIVCRLLLDKKIRMVLTRFFLRVVRDLDTPISFVA